MNSNNNSLREHLNNWLEAAEPEERKTIWKSILSVEDTADAEEQIYDLIQELREAVRDKQAIAEERQILLNKWQKEISESEQNVASFRRKMEETHQEVKKMEQRMKGYEDQFIRLQNACQAQKEAAEKERDQAWEQFRDREQQLDQVRTELRDAKEQVQIVRIELTERSEAAGCEGTGTEATGRTGGSKAIRSGNGHEGRRDGKTCRCTAL